MRRGGHREPHTAPVFSGMPEQNPSISRGRPALTRQIHTCYSPGAAQPTPKLGISSPELWLWADPRASPRAVLVAQHRQAADALWCKKSVGWTCPAPHLSPHVTRVPSHGVSPSGSHAPLTLGRLGISPAVPRGLLPHRAEERLQIQPGATARTHSKLGNGEVRAGFTKCCL